VCLRVAMHGSLTRSRGRKLSQGHIVGTRFPAGDADVRMELRIYESRKNWKLNPSKNIGGKMGCRVSIDAVPNSTMSRSSMSRMSMSRSSMAISLVLAVRSILSPANQRCTQQVLLSTPDTGGVLTSRLFLVSLAGSCAEMDYCQDQGKAY